MNIIEVDKNCLNCKYFVMQNWQQYLKIINLRGICSHENSHSRQAKNFECKYFEPISEEKSPLVSIDERLKNIENLLIEK